MFAVKITRQGKGLHSSEVIVSINTIDGGKERLIVDERSIRNETLEVGYPIAAHNSNYLIELPNETLRGLWRIWVEQKNTVEMAT